jgi:hypothetical protein
MNDSKESEEEPDDVVNSALDEEELPDLHQTLPPHPNYPSTQEVRDRLKEEIWNMMENGKNGIINAVTSSGKSTNGAATPWLSYPDLTGGEPVIHLHGSKDSRDDAIRKSEEADVSYHVLKGREEACPVAAGDHDDEVETPDGSPASEWLNRQCQGSGISFNDAHQYLEEENGDDLPCASCDSKHQYEGIPRDENGDPAVDVIHATHPFAYVPNLVDSVNIIIDEQPDFSVEVGQRGLSQQQIQDMVTAWLKEIDTYANTWESFVTFSRNEHEKMQKDLKSHDSADPDWVIENEDAHVLAPAITKALYKGLSNPSDKNGRHTGKAQHQMSGTKYDPDDFWDDPADEEDFRYDSSRVTVVVDTDNKIQSLWNVPQLGNARSIICLDAWPSVPKYHQNIGENLSVRRIMSPEERTKWRKFERNLEVVQIGGAARPAASEYAAENYFRPEKARVVIEWLRSLFGEKFRSAIAPKQIRSDIEQMMEEVGVENAGDWMMNQGGEKSRNEFSEERVGLVTNCIDPGDDYVLDLLAARELDATVETDENGDRSPGRGFVGPDAEKAEEILASIRENHTNQSIGRWARKPDDEDVRSIVFVRTNTADNTLIDARINDPWMFGEKQKAAINYLRENPDSTIKQAADTVSDSFDNGVTKESVGNAFRKLVEFNAAEKSEGTGAYGADEYRLTMNVPEDGLVNYPHMNRLGSPNDP